MNTPAPARRRLAPLLLALAFLAPSSLAGDPLPDVSGTLFPCDSTVSLSVRKVGRVKEKRVVDFLHEGFIFEVENTLGGGITGFQDIDFNPARMEPDEPESLDYMQNAVADLLDELGIDGTVDGATFVKGKGTSRATASKLTWRFAFALRVDVDVSLTIDGEPLETRATLTMKGRTVLDQFLDGTVWDVDTKMRGRLQKVGGFTDEGGVDLEFAGDNTFVGDDSTIGGFEGNWTVDDKDRVTLDVDEEELAFFLEDIAAEIEAENFVFLDELEVTLDKIVTRVKIKAGVSIVFSMSLRFTVTAVLDGQEPIEAKGSYSVRGRGCFGF